MTTSHLGEPHHDGSELYVPEPPSELGDEVTVRLRVPRGSAVGEVALRYMHDGEPRVARAVVDEETATDTWWRATFTAWNRSTRYRWLVSGGTAGYGWITGVGRVPFDRPDADDFVVSTGATGPDWHLDAVVYEIFPDRFATTGAAVGEPPPWAVRRGWDDVPVRLGDGTGAEWFGGDLRGIEERLDHVESLGANVLYLTPVFPAGSTHRYDAVAFDRVDPLLGGDEALASLTAAAHDRGMRVLGDLTLNHTGDGHDWFRAARADEQAPERSFFLFDDDVLHGYETWLGVRTLPKLDHRSEELRRRLVDGPDSVVQRWLRQPYGLDGWRIDVANMTGRHRDVDVNLAVAAAIRHAVGEATTGQGLLVAEHGHDARTDLPGDGWQGVMSYMGFLRPVWAWLRGDELPGELADGFLGLPVGVPRIDGKAAHESMRAFRAGVPWPATLHSWLLLDSHDTARFGVVAGDRDRQLVGVGLQLTGAGVPMVWAGDELGVGGLWGEDARRPMPWDAPERWDATLLAGYRELVALRRSSEALRRGGLRTVAVGPDAIATLRETPGERVLCLAARTAHPAIRVPRAALGCTELETLVGGDARRDGDDVVLPDDGPAFHAWRVI
jgi:alpha-glucosidase